jgi:hypothetical protein
MDGVRYNLVKYPRAMEIAFLFLPRLDIAYLDWIYR